MFARKLALTLSGAPVPKAWLDQFFMRDFTGCSAFDETLPAGDGKLEASFRVDPEELKAQFEEWLRGRKMIGPDAELAVQLHPKDTETPT